MVLNYIATCLKCQPLSRRGPLAGLQSGQRPPWQLTEDGHATHMYKHASLGRKQGTEDRSPSQNDTMLRRPVWSPQVTARRDALINHTYRQFPATLESHSQQRATIPSCSGPVKVHLVGAPWRRSHLRPKSTQRALLRHDLHVRVEKEMRYLHTVYAITVARVARVLVLGAASLVLVCERCAKQVEMGKK
jgi:hypothetical protein